MAGEHEPLANNNAMAAVAAYEIFPDGGVARPSTYVHIELIGMPCWSDAADTGARQIEKLNDWPS